MKPKTTWSVTIAAIAVIAVGLSLFFRNAAAEAAYPVERIRTGPIRAVVSRLRGMARGYAMVTENARLSREVASLTVARADVERLESENARLRSALDFSARAPGMWIAAEVLSENGAAAGRRRTLRLDRGSLAGIVKNAVVVAPQGLVGLVTTVTPHTSEVTLVSDPSVKVSCEVECAGKRLPHGILCGGTDDLLEVRYLSRSGDVSPRSRVLTSGLGGIFPRGLEIGTLQSVCVSGTGYDKGEVLPSVDFSSLECVFVRRER